MKKLSLSVIIAILLTCFSFIIFLYLKFIHNSNELVFLDIDGDNKRELLITSSTCEKHPTPHLLGAQQIRIVDLQDIASPIFKHEFRKIDSDSACIYSPFYDAKVLGTIRYLDKEAVVVVTPSSGNGAYKGYILIANVDGSYKKVFESESKEGGRYEIYGNSWITEQYNDNGATIKRLINFKSGSPEEVRADL